MKKKREEKNMYQVKYKAKFTYFLMLNNIPPKKLRGHQVEPVILGQFLLFPCVEWSVVHTVLS